MKLEAAPSENRELAQGLYAAYCRWTGGDWHEPLEELPEASIAFWDATALQVKLGLAAVRAELATGDICV